MEFLRVNGWGRIFAKDRSIDLYPFEPWAFDNGAFEAWLCGHDFPSDTFLRRLERAMIVPSDPVLAVAPDIVAGGLKSLEFSVSWLRRLPRWPWYLAVQDGMDTESVSGVAHLFSGIFLGGTDRFKLSAYRWIRLARLCGKPFHYGRAGTLRKIRHAWKIGSDSIDSSFPLWTKQRMVTFSNELAALRRFESPCLPGLA